MLANRVHETSASTGVGNFTLAGAATNMRTFTSQFAVNQRFSYFIDDSAGEFESGIGYLSDATTLVRETVLDSSNAGAAVNFIAGEKQVFVAQSAYLNFASYKASNTNTNQDNGWLLSPHIPYDELADATGISTNTVYCVPFFHRGGSVTDMGTKFTSTLNSATKFRLGIYECRYDATVGVLLAQTGDIAPVANSFVSASLTTSVSLPLGWYYTAYLDDGGARLRGQNGNRVSCSPLGS